ncbi:MAG: response regulator transcription factor [Sulfuritalea sp.]|nr:response regulator transcription factor [Sulfuritalea sp.]
MIRLLIADDHAIVREGLKQFFTLVDDIAVIGEAENGAQVLNAMRGGGIDLLLLDMTMPGICGVELVSRIRMQDAKMPILVLSMHNESQIVKRALKSGASGYLTKDSDPERLLAAIRKVAGGGRYIDPVVAEQMAFEIAGESHELAHERLSDREFEVLMLLSKGQGVNEIADMLSISNKTVSTHKARLMEKMGMRSNAELVRYAVDNGLLE